MKLTQLLKGRKINVMTDAKVVVQLEVATAEQVQHSRDLETPTQKNDWWPKTQDWTTIEVGFTNGHTKSYPNFDAIDLVE